MAGQLAPAGRLGDTLEAALRGEHVDRPLVVLAHGIKQRVTSRIGGEGRVAGPRHAAIGAAVLADPRPQDARLGVAADEQVGG